MTVTFGLDHPKESHRIDAAAEPDPHRWTHHVMVGSPDEIDDELMSKIDVGKYIDHRPRLGWVMAGELKKKK